MLANLEEKLSADYQKQKYVKAHRTLKIYNGDSNMSWNLEVVEHFFEAMLFPRNISHQNCTCKL